MKIACLAAFASLRGALLITALATFAGAQNQTWIRQFGTNVVDGVVAAAPDGAGGVFVSGSTNGSLDGPNAGIDDAWIAHYDGTGSQTWIRQFGTPFGETSTFAVPDGAGGVYVSGVTHGNLGGPNAGLVDVWLARYDSAGNQAWIRQFGTTRDDRSFAAASDGTGGVYVSGYTFGSLGGPNTGQIDAWIAHYDGAGNQTWIRQFGTPDSEFAHAAAPDGAGGVYVSGYTFGSLGGPNVGHADVWIARYDSAGNQTWIRQFGSIGSDAVRAAAPDGSGGVYLSGDTYGSLGAQNAGNADVWLAHFDGAGNQTWTRQFGTINHEHAFAAAPDESGGVYVSGWTDGSLGNSHAGNYDAWLAHYDGTGSQDWIRQLGTSANDHARTAAPDGAGGVYVSGYTGGSLGGPTAGASDAWLAHYDGLIASRYCTPAIPNSTGEPGLLSAIGSNDVARNDLTVEASQLALNSFGFFLTSQSQGFVTQPGGSQGILCLGGAIGRFVGPGQIQNSGSTGSFSLALDLTAMAHPVSPLSVQPGQTWSFQAWCRDANPGPTSNFTDAVSVTFQ